MFTFWSSHLKLVKMLSKEGEDGRFFGFLDSGRGLVEAVLASITLSIFTVKLSTGTDIIAKKEALVPVIYIYSIVLLVTSILIFVFVKEDTPTKSTNKEDNKGDGFKFSDIGKIFKNKYVLFQGIIVFAGYTLYWTNYCFGVYFYKQTWT